MEKKYNSSKIFHFFQFLPEEIGRNSYIPVSSGCPGRNTFLPEEKQPWWYADEYNYSLYQSKKYINTENTKLAHHWHIHNNKIGIIMIIFDQTYMAQCKTAMHPLLTQWGYCSLVLIPCHTPWSYDRLISTMGFPILVRRHLYIESGPWSPNQFYACGLPLL